MKTDKRALSVYIHIPFCIRKCLYCDFLSAPATDEMRTRYLKCLSSEIERESHKYCAYKVRTVFVGGGTPSLLSGNEMKQLLECVKLNYDVAEDAEITAEVNPGTVNLRKLEGYYEAGINRLSIGLQSADNKELQCLGRIHSYEEFLQTYENAVKTGFNNINIDLMSAIPGQTVESYQKTLKAVLSLNPSPTHISAYSLILEEGTPFGDNPPELPDEETDREMYKITDEMLKDSGYHRYEISNYAKEGYECIHNKVYWKRGDYVGFGIGAASLVDNVRFHNIADIEEYMGQLEKYKEISLPELHLKEDIQSLSVEEQMEEYMFLGLRLTEGISEKDFFETFQKSIHEVYPGLIAKLKKQGLIICEPEDENGNRIKLSDFGLDVSNVVMAEFLLTE
ncbi:MAG: oxygen-independent coproporphyrinogen III oxidase [Lachnospiraceae bacterium]|nr:oxygen-independent coproporphyrinogen III oxidase [Lachnospiraceae bacterium]